MRTRLPTCLSIRFGDFWRMMESYNLPSQLASESASKIFRGACRTDFDSICQELFKPTEAYWSI
jgi:hypothetical protein